MAEEKKITIEEAALISGTVERAYQLQEKIKTIEGTIEADFGAQLKDLDKELKACKKEILAFAEDKDKTEFSYLVEMPSGKEVQTKTEIKPSSKGFINVKAFAEFCIKEHRREAFYECVTVGLTKACGNFGEKVLEQHNILTTEVKKFGRVVMGVLK